MYFKSLKYLLYPEFNSQTDEILTTNIFKRVVLRNDLIVDNSNYYEYTLTDSETLESLSDKLYGSPYYYWVILFMNERLDPVWDMPLDDGSFNNFIIDKYGTAADAKNIEDEYSGTYSISGTTATISTSPEEHGLSDGRKINLEFGSGSLLNGVYTIDYVSNTEFTVTVEDDNDGTGTVTVSPPYVYYYIKNHASDEEYTKTDKETYDATSGSLRTKTSAYDEESILNFNKRIIKVLKPEVFADFLAEFEKKLA